MDSELHFENRQEFREWLEQARPDAEGVWLVFSKTGKIRSITAAEALEEALCFGWIDGLMKRIDGEMYKKYFSPRRKGSAWSARNRELAERLLKSGRIEKAGLAVIERARRDGTWESRDENTVTEVKFRAFESRIAGNRKAAANYLAMPQSVRRQFVGLYFEPKKETTRERRLVELIDLLEHNTRPMDSYAKRGGTP